MKSRRRQNRRPRAAASRTDNIPVHRYSHPISAPVRRASATEEPGIRETLQRQTEMLEELLRRTEGYISDAK